MTDRRTRVTGYLTAAAVLLVDQVAKRMAQGGLEIHQPQEILGSFLRLTLAWNRGAAFSLSWGGPLFLTIVTAAAAAMVSVFIWKMADHPPLFVAGLGAILGGALGNLLDRFMYGMVIDFIDVGLGTRRWPTFNVADIAITMGGLILVILYRKHSAPDEDSGDGKDGGQ